MLGPIQRRQNYPYRQQPQGMNSFMFGTPQQSPMPRSRFPVSLQKITSGNLLHNPQISKGISGFSGILSNIQQVLRVVETTTPMIKEYGPMLKNLPAMYRMVKAFKSIDDLPEEEKKEEANIERNPEKEKNIATSKVKTTKKKNSGLSTPKLYI
ncbi:YqfQ family protein [Oceanobacillus alkalisoli]|uniref:YqfQ family protein n=1 Tax=Oceanobacillus alkalisoli TaxID=2925113 RepID=UPI001EF149D9|nr:YqfQ family protein [Oceanobacillus alkalisoli]MCF3941538.1 YqfQ family protein [Oceanobacillus alkalisoli]MCG5102872.1 YqfQ family protein [Oceanobacillus alkalisoli]